MMMVCFLRTWVGGARKTRVPNMNVVSSIFYDIYTPMVSVVDYQIRYRCGVRKCFSTRRVC